MGGVKGMQEREGRRAPCYGVGRLRPSDVVLAAGVGHPEADGLVLELPVLAAMVGIRLPGRLTIQE